MSAPPDPDLLDAIAADLGVDPSFIEKDWYAMQLVALLVGLEHNSFRLVFSGGTSLSKGHNLIQRFSEDLDFKLMMPSDGISRAVRRSYRMAIIDAIRSNDMWTLDDRDIEISNEGCFFCCLIGYPNRLTAAPSLRPHLKLEVTFLSPALSPELRPLQSFVAQARKEAPEVAEMPCVSAVETAADKLGALTWRVLSRQRGSDTDDPTLIRHLHDLAALEPLVIGHGAFPALVGSLLTQDANRGSYAPEITAITPHERLDAALAILSSDTEYVTEYQRFVVGMSYAAQSETPSFEDALQAAHRLRDRVV